MIFANGINSSTNCSTCLSETPRQNPSPRGLCYSVQSCNTSAAGIYGVIALQQPSRPEKLESGWLSAQPLENHYGHSSRRDDTPNGWPRRGPHRGAASCPSLDAQWPVPRSAGNDFTGCRTLAASECKSSAYLDRSRPSGSKYLLKPLRRLAE